MSIKRNNLKNFFKKNKRTIVIAIKICIAIALLIFLANYLDFDNIQTSLENADLIYIVIAAILVIPNLFFQYYKWKIVCNSILDEYNRKKIFLSLFYGLTAGTSTPSRLGEYAGRAVVFPDRNFFEIVIATIVDKIFPLLTITFFGAISALIFLRIYYDVTAYIIIALTILILAVFIFLIIIINNRYFWGKIILAKLSKIKFLHKGISKIKIIQHLTLKDSIKISIISFLFYSTFIIQFGLLVAAFTNQNDLLIYFWAGSLVMFSNSIVPQITFGELGFREGASVLFLGVMGSSEAAGFNASIFLFLINLVLPAIIGLLLLIKKSNG